MAEENGEFGQRLGFPPKVGSIAPNGSIPTELRGLVEASFENALKEIGEEEFFYIGRNFKRKTRAIENSRIPWVRDLVAQMRKLNLLYVAHTSGEIELREEVLNLIGATLFYFVNPFDLIPDHVPARGYLDDAHVFNLCVERLKKLAPFCVE